MRAGRDAVSAGIAVRAADLELALRTVGVSDQTVPARWDGAQLTVRTSAVVVAEWPDIVMLQSLPLTLAVPAGFDFPAFSAIVLRVLGVGPEEAQRLAQRMGTAPPWLAPIAGDFQEGSILEEIALNSGPATLLEETGYYGTQRTLVWSVPDRVYVLRGTLSRELTIAAANAVQ